MENIFRNTKNIAVLGMSKNSAKAANSVPMYMKSNGYTIIPINPSIDEIDGLKSYSSIDEVPDRIDMLNVFRPSEDCTEIVRQAVKRHNEKGDIDTIWLQLGIENEEAKQIALSAGIRFVQNKCLYIEHRFLN